MMFPNSNVLCKVNPSKAQKPSTGTVFPPFPILSTRSAVSFPQCKSLMSQNLNTCGNYSKNVYSLDKEEWGLRDLLKILMGHAHIGRSWGGGWRAGKVSVSKTRRHQCPRETPNKIIYICNPNTEWDGDRQSLLDNQFSQS